MIANEISMPVALVSAHIPATEPGTPAQAVDARNPAASRSSRQDQQNSPVDSVTILNKLQDTKRAARKEEAGKSDKNDERTMQSIQFAYNNKGDLRIRFTDSRSKLVYQTPPVYFSMMYDLMSRPESSVNTEA